VNTALGRTRQETRLGHVARQPQKPRAAKVYHVTDPNPIAAILPILHRFKNESIRIVAYSGTQAEYVRHLVEEGYPNGMLVNVPSESNVVTRTVYHNYPNSPEWRPSTNDDGVEMNHESGITHILNKVFKSAIYDWVVQYPIKPIEPRRPVPFLHPGDMLKVYLI